MSKLVSYLQLIRPLHWPKNLLVFVGIVYSRQWGAWALWQHVIVISLAFCCISSATYIMNDIHDRDSDRNHPLKKNRPIANGAVSVSEGYWLCGCLFIVSLGLSDSVSVSALILLLSYGVLNIVYTFCLKDIPIIDSCCIALGFVLRILAGTIGIEIQPSLSLILCAALLTLFLGFSKRRAEMNMVGNQLWLTRPVLKQYDQHYLTVLIVTTAVLSLGTYTIYCLNHPHLIMTLPLAVFGILRYLYILYATHARDDPIMLVFNDRYSLINLGLWLTLTLYLL